MASLSKKSAIQKINKNGVLLVFPIKNKKEPNSLWQEFFPKKAMKWDWNESAANHNRIADMWRLMKDLSDKREVVYSKWYQGRATFFSKDLFTALLSSQKESLQSPESLSPTAQQILDILESDSPLSTKELKKAAELQGRDNEPAYTKAMKQLFNRLFIIAYGEVDDGAFPSLAVGSTKNLYEDLWQDAQTMPAKQAAVIIEKYMPTNSLFKKYLNRTI